MYEAFSYKLFLYLVETKHKDYWKVGDVLKLYDHFNPSVLNQTVKTQMKCSIKLHVTIVSAPFDENTTAPRDRKGIAISLFYINFDLTLSPKETMGSASQSTGLIANTPTTVEIVYSLEAMHNLLCVDILR